MLPVGCGENNLSYLNISVDVRLKVHGTQDATFSPISIQNPCLWVETATLENPAS